MTTALYYPHSRIENEALVKTSLVLFDRVEWIAPDDKYEPEYSNPRLSDAMSLVGQRHIPNQEEKELVHMLSFEVDGKNFVIEDWRGGDA